MRALVLTLTAVAVGVGAHVIAGGTIAAAGVVAGAPLLFGLSWMITDRERGWLPIAGAQLAGQQVVHSLLGIASPEMSDSAVPLDLFLYGHVVAAALVAVWLRCGERRVWAAARRAIRSFAAHWRRLLTLLGHHPTSGPAPRTRVVAAPVPCRRAPLRHTVIRRGPPALV